MIFQSLFIFIKVFFRFPFWVININCFPTLRGVLLHYYPVVGIKGLLLNIPELSDERSGCWLAHILECSRD